LLFTHGIKLKDVENKKNLVVGADLVSASDKRKEIQ